MVLVELCALDSCLAQAHSDVSEDVSATPVTFPTSTLTDHGMHVTRVCVCVCFGTLLATKWRRLERPFIMSHYLSCLSLNADVIISNLFSPSII